MDRYDDIKVPPRIPHPAVQKAAENYEEAGGRWREARAEAVELKQTRPQAVERDRQAYADALEAGKPAPKAQHTKRADERLAEAERFADATETALGRARERLLEAVSEHRDELLEATEDGVREVRGGLAEAIDALERHYGELGHALSLRAWVGGFPHEKPRPGAYAAFVALARQGDDGRVPVANLVAALRPLCEEPQRSAPTPPPQVPLRQVA